MLPPLCLQPQTFLDPQQAGGVPHFSFFPSTSPASQQKPRGCKLDSFRAPVVLHLKSASRRRMPVVTATVMSPHAFVCLYALFSPFYFFFPLVAENLALRLAGACIHQCSTCVRLCHLGADLFVGGFLIIAYTECLDDMSSQSQSFLSFTLARARNH